MAELCVDLSLAWDDCGKGEWTSFKNSYCSHLGLTQEITLSTWFPKFILIGPRLIMLPGILPKEMQSKSSLKKFRPRDAPGWHSQLDNLLVLPQVVIWGSWDWAHVRLCAQRSLFEILSPSPCSSHLCVLKSISKFRPKRIPTDKVPVKICTQLEITKLR